jgi:hypothetical protein
MSESNPRQSISALGVNHVVIEDQSKSRAKQALLATALSVAMASGALAAPAPGSAEIAPSYSAADFAMESIDKKVAMKMEYEESERKRQEDEQKEKDKNKEPVTRSGAALDAMLENQGLGKDKSTFEKIAGIAGSVLVLGGGQSAIFKAGTEAVVASTVGASSKDAKKGVAAAGLVGDAIFIAETGGYGAIPVAYRYGKDALDAYKESEQKRIEENLEKVKDRTVYVAEVYTYSMRLEAREKRMAASPEDQAAYNKRMLEDAKTKVEVGGYASESLNNAIELEEMVKSRGGQTEAWYDQYLQYKSEYKPAEPELQDFFGKVGGLDTKGLGLASSTDFLRTLMSGKDQNHRLEIG